MGITRRCFYEKGRFFTMVQLIAFNRVGSKNVSGSLMLPGSDLTDAHSLATEICASLTDDYNVRLSSDNNRDYKVIANQVLEGTVIISQS